MLLLYEPMPFRTTRMLGDFADSAALAYVFGDLTESRFPLRRISPTRGHAADHPMEITAAFVGSERTDSWQAVVTADITGHVCTFVDFGAPVPADEQMSACGRGMRHPATNALIENPGEIMERLAIIAGRSDKFQALREECAAADIRIGMWACHDDGTERSIRGTLDIPAQSAGAIWCPPGMSRRYPATVSGYVLELDKHSASGISVSASVEDTADVLRVAYDVSAATGKPRKHLELTASPALYGGAVKEITLPCIRSAACAVTVCTPILQRLAGQRVDVGFSSRDASIGPGQWVKLVAHPEWPMPGADPVIMVLATEESHANRSVQVTGEAMLTTPAVSVTAHSIALDDTFDGSLEVAERKGIATFTVRDESGRGIAGARVSFDGSPAKTTDARGQVSFPYTPGEHEIAIEAPGRVPQTIQVTL